MPAWTPNKGRLQRKTAPTRRPTMLDIAWAAGVWEGEGSIAAARRTRPSTTITVYQNDREILDRLKELFGGSIYTRRNKKGFTPTTINHVWTLCGPRGRGFIYTIFTWLCRRRRTQVKQALRMSEVML